MANSDCKCCGHTEAMHDRMRNFHRRCISFGCGCDDYTPEFSFPHRIAIWSQMDAECGRCGKSALKWPPGLCTRDREAGMDTGDFITCPDCVSAVHFKVMDPDSTVAMLRDNPNAFAYIHWFWSV